MFKGLFAIALVAASISYIISMTAIFAPIRNLIGKLGTFVDKFIHCPFCQSFWIVGLLVYFANDLNYIDFVASRVINFILTWFSVMPIVAIIHYVMLRAYKPVAEAGIERLKNKLKSKK